MTQKTALVTGGSRGIGRGTAALLERRGYRVAVADLDRPVGGAAAFFRCDVSSETAVRACVRGVLHRFGRLDALINNAGLADPADAPVEKLTLAAWNRRIGVNLTGVFLMTKHCVPHLRRSAGAIVNIASTRALQSEPNTEAYAATKGGVVALTHALAMSLGPRIQWVQSYVTDEKIFCVYIAPNPELIREHAVRGGFPADAIREVKAIIDPTTSE